MSTSDAAVPADAERDDVIWALTEELEEAREELDRLRGIEQRAREVVGTLQPETTKSLAARGRTRVHLARWILGETS